MKNSWVQFVKLGAICFWVRFWFVSGLEKMQKEIEVSQKNMQFFFSLLLQTSACDDLDFVAKLERKTRFFQQSSSKG